MDDELRHLETDARETEEAAGRRCIDCGVPLGEVYADTEDGPVCLACDDDNTWPEDDSESNELPY